MCTINSLDRNWRQFIFHSSLRTVLVLLICYFNQDSSGALQASQSVLAITVNAPSDFTINISRPSGCDTVINLPPATYSGQCPGPLTFNTYSVFTSLNTNGGNMYFTTGVFKVYYRVTDNCGMTGLDSMLVSIFDDALPNVVCNPQMTMNLPSNGYLDAPAWIFDAGSFDSCGHVYFKVKRMFAPSGYSCSNPGNPNNAFDDQVRFCCQDVDSSAIMIILRVYDIAPGFGPVNDSLLEGRFVDCMIQAIVGDKIPPDIDCPNNVTVNCGADLDSVFAVNPNPVVTDNCSSFSIETIIDNNLDACGSGTISRTFIATDRNGQSASCTQVITVLKVNTFNGLDTNQLKWPAHKIIFACRIDPDTINAGIPVIREDGCANVQISHRDEKYNFDRGGVCAKILRYWEVIDWCKYNPAVVPNPKISSNGYYSFVQEIKIMDTIAPVLSGLRDTIIGIQTAFCEPGFVNLPTVFADDCGTSSNISMSFEVDYFNDGQIDHSGQGGNASGLYPIGRHRLKFFANDSCHNTGTLEVILEVIDTKPPNANAIFGLSSSLIQMQAGPMVSIQAKLFNAKSNDNCTEEAELRFSFSSDIHDTIRVFNCDSLGLRIIHLVVWDLSGNSSEVSTFINILDVNNLCPSAIKGVQINGTIATRNDQPVKDVDVYLSYENTEIHDITDPEGKFAFYAIPRNKIVTLRSGCSKNFVDGISTADIIKIQRHLLGLEIIENPLDLLAADVDLNKRISTKDITWMRKLILGQISEIPNQDSYLFINKNYSFKNPLNPFEEMDSSKQVSVETINEDYSIELLGVKLGDVNHSFRANGLQVDNQNQVQFNYQINNGVLEIYVNDSRIIDGFQFEIVYKDLCLEPWTTANSNLINWTESNYNIDGSKIRISYSHHQAFLIEKHKPFLMIPFHASRSNCEPNLYLSSSFQNELYSKNEVLQINELVREVDHKTQGEVDIDVYPNPFSDQLNIRLKSGVETSFQLEVYTMELKSVISTTYQFQKGENIIELKKQQLPGSGIYIMNIKSSKISKIIKIVNE